ncbi:RagB/SusD family nutrient uptake outer membrane protein [Parabacteroides pacaensis]|uniref:RagB/SusD family nutrient uptake outer membrane protein n=1 Tax=Parabacteroides pacaensis TaxID=2086575 RepID=UPI000D112269|nr:RagB/SusD family nutrient uptake outer membrane protein [Parabacteroides pacaensis]
MKHTIYIYLITIAAVVGFSSCNGLLDVPPQGKLTFEQFWQSNDQAVAALAGIYANLGSTYHDFKSGNMSAKAISPVESYIYWGELRGEILAVNLGKFGSEHIAKENVDYMNIAPVDVTTKFTAFYRIINEANLAIKYIPAIKEKNPAFLQEMEDHLMGEAYFLRAYTYFWLVRTFKEIPLVLVPSESDEQDYNLPKSGTADIYARIIADLEIARKTLPLWYENDQYSRCRATRYTAMTVLADVYLTMAAVLQDEAGKANWYDEAIRNCDEVIASRRYNLLPGIEYGNIFLNGNTEESIWETYSNSKVNNQVNNLYDWFTSKGYFMASNSADELFAAEVSNDYRGSTPPKGPYPAAGSEVGYASSSRYINKYKANTKDARWIFYRFPEVLLMKAEALAHRYPDDANKLAEAGELIDRIRLRAYGITDYPRVEATTTYEMDNIILDERGKEFIGEGKRWFELVRFASRDNFAHKELLLDRVVNSFSGVDQLVIAPRIHNPESWYLPLNADALAANINLVQNPYYQ